MIGLTDREREMALASAGPPSPFSFALAELNMYWDQHSKGRPDLGHEPVISFHLKNEGTPEERIAAVKAVAKWLGVRERFENGVWFAQRRFGTRPHSILVEAHYTPDHDAAFAALQRQADERKQDGEGAGAEQETAAAA